MSGAASHPCAPGWSLRWMMPPALCERRAGGPMFGEWRDEMCDGCDGLALSTRAWRGGGSEHCWAETLRLGWLYAPGAACACTARLLTTAPWRQRSANRLPSPQLLSPPPSPRLALSPLLALPAGCYRVARPLLLRSSSPPAACVVGPTPSHLYSLSALHPACGRLPGLGSPLHSL